ncbi:hypothetical protein [Tenacibaculum ovolyticum]|uniref:hypothetical protein n=1 Tax=Tenacibaculum ovolyticum TaxID=104270 RepID=UPI0007ED0ED7|nr:hypothetical protein [Tenacibaculum ovolyticum]
MKINNYKKTALTHILAFYSSEEIKSIEHYEVSKGRLNAAKSLSIDVANELFENLQYNKGVNLSFRGLIPKNIIYTDITKQSIVWKVKSHKRKLFFKNDSFSTNEYLLPHLIFSLKGTTLSVFATKTFNITENTKLYNAPFLNVWSDGSVCMGSASIKKEDISFFEELIIVAENLFFDSYFTHTNHNIIVKGSLIELYDTLKNKTVFPNNLLIQSQTKNIKKLCL